MKTEERVMPVKHGTKYTLHHTKNKKLSLSSQLTTPLHGVEVGPSPIQGTENIFPFILRSVKTISGIWILVFIQVQHPHWSITLFSSICSLSLSGWAEMGSACFTCSAVKVRLSSISSSWSLNCNVTWTSGHHYLYRLLGLRQQHWASQTEICHILKI